MADPSTAALPILDPIAGRCCARCQLHNGIMYVSVALKLRISLFSVEGVRYQARNILLYGRLLHNRRTDFDSVYGGLLGLTQLPNGIRYISVASRLKKSLSSVEGVLGIKLAIFYLMADYSTTAGRIFILFQKGCWARCQLVNNIRYVSVASKLRISLSSLEGVLGIKLAILYSMADYSTTA